VSFLVKSLYQSNKTSRGQQFRKSKNSYKCFNLTLKQTEGPGRYNVSESVWFLKVFKIRVIHIIYHSNWTCMKVEGSANDIYTRTKMKPRTFPGKAECKITLPVVIKFLIIPFDLRFRSDKN
jgi:hypothetical protein